MKDKINLEQVIKEVNELYINDIHKFKFEKYEAIEKNVYDYRAITIGFVLFFKDENGEIKFNFDNIKNDIPTDKWIRINKNI